MSAAHRSSVVYVSLTAAGSKLLARAPASTQDRLIAALALMGVSARTRLARDLHVLLDAMGVEPGHPPMLFETPAPARKVARRARPRSAQPSSSCA